MEFEKNDRMNKFQLFASIVLYAIVLSFFYQLRSEPQFPDSFRVLANLRSLAEEGRFLSPEAPLPILLVSIWKSITGFNYDTAYHSFLAFWFSASIHLVLYMFNRRKWRTNHFLFAYLAGLTPFTYLIPLEHLNETVCLTFILLLILSFRLETILDLVLIVVLTVGAFFSDFTFFMVGFTAFIIHAATLGLQERRRRQSVFFKKANTPKLILMLYLVILVLLIGFAVAGDFYGTHSFSFLLGQSWAYLKHFGLLILLLIAGGFLLNSEKELNSVVASGIIVLLIGVGGFFSWKDKGTLDLENLAAGAKDLSRYLGGAVILPKEKVYVPQDVAQYVYYHTKQKLDAQKSGEWDNSDWFLVGDITDKERVSIDRKYRYRDDQMLKVAGNQILITYRLASRLVREYPDESYTAKISNSMESIPVPRGIDSWNRFLTGIFSDSYLPTL